MQILNTPCPISYLVTKSCHHKFPYHHRIFTLTFLLTFSCSYSTMCDEHKWNSYICARNYFREHSFKITQTYYSNCFSYSYIPISPFEIPMHHLNYFWSTQCETFSIFICQITKVNNRNFCVWCSQTTLTAVTLMITTVPTT